MTNYEKIEACCKKYHEVFKYLEQEFYKKFDIPEHIIRDTIKGYLVQIVCNQGVSIKLLKKET